MKEKHPIRRHRRAKRNRNKNLSKKLKLIGVNAAGLSSKLTSFTKVLKELQPSVFIVQETKFKKERALSIDGYTIYDLVREFKDGGGLLIGCAKEVNPVMIRKGNDNVEAITVEISVSSMVIRCCGAYGPQENCSVDKKDQFWKFVEKEAIEAWNLGAGFILQFDGNLWCGPDVIPGDPNYENKNGKLFKDFLSRQSQLTVVNGLPICKGLITRRRLKQNKAEESIFDFFIVCSRVLPFVTAMNIDEEKNHVLTNYNPAKHGLAAIDTDHFTLETDVNLDISKQKPTRREIFHFKNSESLEVFKSITSETKEFTDCFLSDQPLENQIDRWREVLNNYCMKAFKKVRINEKKSFNVIDSETAALIDRRNKLKKIHQNENEIKEIERRISDIEAKKNRDMIMKNFKKFSDNSENVNLLEVWKLLKRLCPKTNNSLPTAKLDHRGQLVSNPQGIKNLLLKEYTQRLRDRPVRPDIVNMKERKNLIFDLQLEIASSKSTPPWTMSELEKALSDLKLNKSRDHAGYANEIFKMDVIGSDLKNSLLLMFNRIKDQSFIPKFMRYANITTVPKKGSQMVLENERGIFRVDVVRSILMKMIYERNYKNIDDNISDCQMGGRKEKGCRNNIFIVNGIIHDVINSKGKGPISLQIYDYAQMVDSIDLKLAISDIYETGLDNDHLSLVYLANKEIFMAVNSPGGLSERHTVRNTVLQGETWSSLLASVQVDKIARKCQEAGVGYKYKNNLPVSLLGLVDDLIGVTETGCDAQKMNAIINVRSAEKGLQFGIKKCKRMVVGAKSEDVVDNDLHVDTWKVEHKESQALHETELVETFSGLASIEACSEQKYLGFVISNTGNNMVNIRALKNKSIGIIKQITLKLDSLNLRKYFFECSKIFLNAFLRSSILYASETYYNLKESELRQIERIEESYLRKILKTSRGCPISQLYLEFGQVPARFEIIKLRLFFLKYILEQDTDSLIHRFLQLQISQPTKNDWVESCKKDLKKLDISLSFEEIRNLSNDQFKQKVKGNANLKGFEYLLEKRGTKGKEIVYTKLEMQEYLLPNNELNIEDQRMIFALRNKMNTLPANFCRRKENKEKCVCGENEENEHIYNCRLLYDEEAEESYEKIYNGTTRSQEKVLRRFENNLKKKQEINSIPCDPIVRSTDLNV